MSVLRIGQTWVWFIQKTLSQETATISDVYREAINL